MRLPIGELSLCIDQKSFELFDFFSINKIKQAAIITAYNPFSVSVTNHKNQKQNEKLYNELKGFNFLIFKGVNVDMKRIWEDEASFLVCNIDLCSAQNIARKYQQTAIVFIKKEAIPHLISCSST